MAQERLILAIPAGPREQEQPRHSEGSRLAVPTHTFLQKGLGLRYPWGSGQYHSLVRGVPIEIAEFKGPDVPRAVAEGRAHMGIVGLDHVLNQPNDRLAHIVVLRELGYGKCDFRLGVPIPKGQGYSPDSPAARARLEDVIDLRVATALPVLARRIFDERKIGVTIIAMGGHVENAIRYGMADAIVDITESGGTMIRHQIAPAEHLESFQAVFIGNDYPLEGRERIKNNLLTRVDRALKRPGRWISPENDELEDLTERPKRSFWPFNRMSHGSSEIAAASTNPASLLMTLFTLQRLPSAILNLWHLGTSGEKDSRNNN
jgi:ATP phosphoribosyltransferase